MSELFGRIVLERKSEWRNRMRGYKVVINGTEQEKKIMNGDSEEYTVPAGANTIGCKVDWCSSNTLDVNVSAGETVYLKVGSGMKYFWAAYVLLLVMLFGRSFFRQQLPESYRYVAIGAAVLVICYFLYYITLGRNKYLLLQEDSKNIFAK